MRHAVAALLAGLVLTPVAETQELPADTRTETRPGTGLLRLVEGDLPVADVPTDAGPRAVALAFAATHATRFGADPSIDLVVASTAPRRVGGDSHGRLLDGDVVRLAQEVHGFPLVGHGLVVTVDAEGRALRAHGALHPTADVVAPPAVDEDALVADALAAAGYARAGLRADPTVSRRARLTPDGVELAHVVHVVRGLVPLRLEVDARTGRLLRTVEDTVHAGGGFHYDDTVVPFKTGKGKAAAYKSVKNAVKKLATPTGLGNLTIEDVQPTYAPDGSLTGRYGQVVDDDGFIIISPLYDYTFDDESYATIGSAFVEHQLFDHANTYAWIDRMGRFFTKVAGPFSADYPILAFVNYDDFGDGYPNAFYTSSDSDGAGGYDPGYFVFGEFSGNTGDPMDDMSRDPSVVCHEYVHGVVDKEGVPWAAAGLDEPPRAVNEAVADYFAAAMLKSPQIGKVFGVHGVEAGATGEPIRDLSNTRTLQDDLFDVVGFSTLLPQEHTAGEIFGAALWRARKALKPKTSDRLVFDTLPDWPVGTAEVGYPVVTPANAQDAYEAFYTACFEAMADALDDGSKKAGKNVGALLSGFLSHGITGQVSVGVRRVDATEGGLALKVKGAFLGSLEEHHVDIELGEGQLLSVSVKGRKGTRVDFAFDDAPAAGDEPPEFEAPKPKKVNAAGTKASVKKVLVNNGRTYRLTVENTDAEGGDYTLVVKVK